MQKQQRDAPAGTPSQRGGRGGLPQVGEPRAVPAVAWTGDGSAAPAQGPASPAAARPALTGRCNY